MMKKKPKTELEALVMIIELLEKQKRFFDAKL